MPSSKSNSQQQIYTNGDHPNHRQPSEASFVMTNGSPPSEASYLTNRTSRSGKVRAKIEVAQNPMCPRIRGLCCLMILFNLALLLICLGFALVLQFFEPGYIWYLGLFMLVFGFVTLIGSFIYCVIICQEHRSRRLAEEEDERYYREEEIYGTRGPPWGPGVPEPLYWGRGAARNEFGSSSEINYDNRSGRSVDGRTTAMSSSSRGHNHKVDNDRQNGTMKRYEQDERY